MNYDRVITDMLKALKEDKSLAQPHKNYAISDLARVQAVIRMAKTTTNMIPPAGTPITASSSLRDDKEYALACTCPEGAESADCPVHGR